MKKSVIIFGMGCLLLLPISKVNAKQEFTYENTSGVHLTEREYNFISNMFYDGYQEIMDRTDYENIFKDRDILNQKIEHQTYEPESSSIMPYATSIDINDRKLTIAKSCTTNCLITITAEWKAMPLNRSYDVIGAYLDRVSLLQNPVTKATNGNTTNTSNDMVTNANGFGVSIKLPVAGSIMKVTQYFTTSKNGTIYGSYQHSMRSVTLVNSKKYTISRSGYGRVFLFDNSVKSYYDGMVGVDIAV